MYLEYNPRTQIGKVLGPRKRDKALKENGLLMSPTDELCEEG